MTSDPLPFTQVDRAVKPKAALLAGHLGVSVQHALGSLVEFWDLCADPRELEAIIGATPDGQELAVVLRAEEVAMRFRLASGHVVEPLALASLGILEPVPDGFRVRGMSRQFDAIEARLRARKAGSAGGKRSVAVRVSATGSAQPCFKGASSTPEAAPKQTPKHSRSTPEALPKQRRSATEAEDRGQRTVEEACGPTAPPVPKKDKPPPHPKHTETAKRMVDAFKKSKGVNYAFQGPKDGAALSALLKEHEPDEIVARWERGLALTGWPSVATVAQLQAKWNDIAGAVPVKPMLAEEKPSPVLFGDMVLHG